MRQTNKQMLEVLLGMVLFLVVVGYAGSIEYTEQVIYNMSQPTYDAIVQKLGTDASQKEIVREYTDNKVYYDTHY